MSLERWPIKSRMILMRLIYWWLGYWAPLYRWTFCNKTWIKATNNKLTFRLTTTLKEWFMAKFQRLSFWKTFSGTKTHRCGRSRNMGTLFEGVFVRCFIWRSLDMHWKMPSFYWLKIKTGFFMEMLLLFLLLLVVIRSLINCLCALIFMAFCGGLISCFWITLQFTTCLPSFDFETIIVFVIFSWFLLECFWSHVFCCGLILKSNLTWSANIMDQMESFKLKIGYFCLLLMDPQIMNQCFFKVNCLWMYQLMLLLSSIAFPLSAF